MGTKKFISNVENSKTNFGDYFEEDARYPGDDKMKLGCLQRIANATEAMSQNYVRMENDLAMYKRWYAENKATIERIVRSNNALRGHLKRFKKQSGRK